MLWYICFYSAAAVLAIALCAIVLMSVTVRKKLEIGKVEHVRWNAYMRSEGYVCAPKNHLAKHHHNLVSVFKLSDEDLRKDG